MSSGPLNSSILKTLLTINRELYELNGENVVDYLGIYISEEPDLAYECTPEDALVFAHTGMGGDHFAFLTLNGSITDLDEAPIVFVQPMMFDYPVKLVARNLKDFLSIFLTLKELYILERFDWYKSKEDMVNDIEKHYKPSIEERKEELDFIIDLLERRLGVVPMVDVFDYIEELRESIRL